MPKTQILFFLPPQTSVQWGHCQSRRQKLCERECTCSDFCVTCYSSSLLSPSKPVPSPCPAGIGTQCLSVPRYRSGGARTITFWVFPLCLHQAEEKTVICFFRFILVLSPLLTQIADLGGETVPHLFQRKKLKCCFASELGAKMLLTFSRHRILKIHLTSYFTGFSVLNLFSVFSSGMSLAHSAGFPLSFGLFCNS